MRACSHLLAKLSPLLGAAVGLEAGDSFSATLTPLQMHLPAECYSLRLEPLKLVLATRGLLSGVITLLKWVSDSLQNGHDNVAHLRLPCNIWAPRGWGVLEQAGCG